MAVQTPTDQTLTERQANFVRIFPDVGNGAEAARLSGYSDAGARQQAAALLAKPNIQAAIAKARESREYANSRSHQDVLSALWRIAETGKLPDTDEKPRTSHALAALAQLGKAYGLDRATTINVDNRKQQVLASLSSEQLTAMLAGGAPPMLEGPTQGG